mgnify:CR=1 FL=1
MQNDFVLLSYMFLYVRFIPTNAFGAGSDSGGATILHTSEGFNIAKAVCSFEGEKYVMMQRRMVDNVSKALELAEETASVMKSKNTKSFCMLGVIVKSPVGKADVSAAPYP